MKNLIQNQIQEISSLSNFADIMSHCINYLFDIKLLSHSDQSYQILWIINWTIKWLIRFSYILIINRKK